MDTETVKKVFDSYLELREARLTAQKSVDDMKEAETMAKELLLELLGNSEGAVISGKIVAPVSKSRPYIVDYAALSNYVVDTGNTQVFNRALNAAALAELGAVPGIGYYDYTDISVRKATK